MLYLKSCLKCRGDMYLDSDSFGSFRQCLQCGKIEDIVDASRVVPAAPIQERQKRRKSSAKSTSTRAVA